MIGANMDHPQEWSSAAAAEMARQARKISCMAPPVFLGRRNLDFASIVQDGPAVIDSFNNADLIDRERCLYLFELDEHADRISVVEAAVTAKKQGAYKLPQINTGYSHTLYVGSSIATGTRRGTLRTRLSQHILGTSSQTYAMSLATWATRLEGGFVVSAWQYPPDGDDEEQRGRILAMEDWLSRQRAPILGRRGIRN